MRNRLVLSLFLALLLGPPAWADFEAGKRAALQGDYATAYQEWLPLAEGGDAEAQFLLGLMYREARGVAQDFAQSVGWLRRAADLGHREAQFYLARAYREHLGVAADDAEAARLLHAAAEQDHAEAAFTLGLMHRRGQGVAKDDLEAARWYLVAAGLGHGEARFTLGAVSEEGTGIAKDMAWAYAWYTLAAESGVELAEVLGKRLLRRMTPAQLARGRGLVQEWRTVPPEFAELERMARVASAAAEPKPAIAAEVVSATGEPAQPTPAVAAEPSPVAERQLGAPSPAPEAPQDAAPERAVTPPLEDEIAAAEAETPAPGPAGGGAAAMAEDEEPGWEHPLPFGAEHTEADKTPPAAVAGGEGGDQAAPAPELAVPELAVPEVAAEAETPAPHPAGGGAVAMAEDEEPGWEFPLPFGAEYAEADKTPPAAATGGEGGEGGDQAAPAPEVVTAAIEEASAAPSAPPAPSPPAPESAEAEAKLPESDEAEADMVERQPIPPPSADTPYRVRLAAFRTVARTNEGWAILSGAHPDLLGDLQLRVERIDLGAEKGVFFRLEVGPLGGAGAARALCAKLELRDVDCVVVRP